MEEIEIKRKEAEIWKQERLGLNSDEDSYVSRHGFSQHPSSGTGWIALSKLEDLVSL